MSTRIFLFVKRTAWAKPYLLLPLSERLEERGTWGGKYRCLLFPRLYIYTTHHLDATTLGLRAENREILGIKLNTSKTEGQSFWYKG